nr:MAG TPA: hypothetical protein [Caudoviricetes sp.]
MLVHLSARLPDPLLWNSEVLLLQLKIKDGELK